MRTKNKLTLFLKDHDLANQKQLGLDRKQCLVSNNNNNNNLHLYSANLYMNIFGCALQYCYIKFMLKVTKA